MLLIGLVQTVFDIYWVILIVRVLMSWVQVDPYNPLVRLLYALTEPLLAPIRRRLPPTTGIDFSPIVAFIIVYLARQIVVSLLISAMR